VTVRALIADDEALARAKLRELLVGVSWIECVGETAHGEETLAAIDSLKPDLVFLDVQMPGPSGIDVLSRARHRPAVIFTTAFDRYAVTAFELQALDYLLKPFAHQRFDAAIQRARRSLELALAPAASDRAQAAFRGSGPLARIFVRDRSRILPVAVDEIERLEAQDDYVMAYAGSRRHLVHLTLSDFEQRLDPQRFVRIHRCHIVNLEHVAGFVAWDGGRLAAQMKDGTTIVASRTRSRDLRKLVR